MRHRGQTGARGPLGSILLTGVFIFIPWTSSWGQGTSVNFETFTDGVSLTNEVSGLTFQNAVILRTGVSLNDVEAPPRSGQAAAGDSGGAMTITFANPASSVAGYFTYGAALTLRAFDAGGAVVASVTSKAGCAANLAASGTSGCAANERLEAAATAITRATVTGLAAGESFVLDDLTYTSSVFTIIAPTEG